MNTHQYIKVSALNSLTSSIIKTRIKIFLCDDADSDAYKKILSYPKYSPDSFTILDRFFDPYFLSEDERCEKKFIRNLIASKIDLANRNQFLSFDNPVEAEQFLFEQVMLFLMTRINGILLADTIYNQEMPDIVDRIFAFCIFGNPSRDILLHKMFNEITLCVVPPMLENYLSKITDSKLLLKYSIASGLIGLDLKGAQCCASKYCQLGIPIAHLLGTDVNFTATSINESLKVIAERDLSIDYWDDLVDEIENKEDFTLLWFTDDFAETMFDLQLILLLLDSYAHLNIVVVPKRGQYGNDASFADVCRFLDLPTLTPLQQYLRSNRLIIHTNGPSMGAINLRKISSTLVESIQTSDALYIKGCRMHEMIQGGVAKKTYTSFVVTRQFTEAETGLDARESCTVLLKSQPNEYAYWGFKGIGTRKKMFRDGRKINVCHSTVIEHERRKSATDPEYLISELTRLISLYDTLAPEYLHPYDLETRLLVDALSAINLKVYDALANHYSEIRNQEPSEKDAKLMNELLDKVRARVSMGILGDSNDSISIVDVGTGHGRDLQYLLKFEDVTATGVDNSDKFISILSELAKNNKIPNDSFYKMDMRNMAIFRDNTFDAVRHNATLLHLPMLPNGIGADEAVAEAFRILKPNGLFYALVKSGSGLECADTGEGLGKRIYQYHTTETITDLLTRNRFRILEMRKRYSERPTGIVEWILVFAEKPDR